MSTENPVLLSQEESLTIRIMGQPWTVETVDQPDEDDPKYISTREDNDQKILIAAGFPKPFRDWQTFLHIWEALYEEFIWGSAKAPSDSEATAVARAVWAGLLDNAEAVATWFGWRTGAPEVPEGELRILGQRWALKRARRIPGNHAGVKGLEQGGTLTFYVRSDVTNHFAAAIALHEMMHALIKAVNRDLGENEALIRPMGLCLAQVFFDNPQVMMHLLGLAQEGAP